MVVGGCGGERPMSGATAFVALAGGLGVLLGAAFVLEFDAGAFGQILDGLDEGEVLKLADELDGISPFLTAEAVVEALLGVDAEGWRLFLVVEVGAESGVCLLYTSDAADE